MSTRLRGVLNLDGGVYVGKNLRSMLNKYALEYKIPHEPDQPLWVWWRDVLRAIPFQRKSLWIFREPRGTRLNESRYKLLCQHFGVGSRRGRRRLVDPVIPRIAANRALRDILGEVPIPMAQEVRWAQEHAIAQQAGINNIPQPPQNVPVQRWVWDAAAIDREVVRRQQDPDFFNDDQP